MRKVAEETLPAVGGVRRQVPELLPVFPLRDGVQAHCSAVIVVATGIGEAGDSCRERQLGPEQVGTEGRGRDPEGVDRVSKAISCIFRGVTKGISDPCVMACQRPCPMATT